ncbi:MAG: hypothetical protein KF716_33800 [Anaerolineae bacterium]|nr:hypothetical protein [Anaerolineae bacterium]
MAQKMGEDGHGKRCLKWDLRDGAAVCCQCHPMSIVLKETGEGFTKWRGVGLERRPTLMVLKKLVSK